MRILITSKYTPKGRNKRGGVQSWIATVEKYLLRMGHEVVQWEKGWAPPGGRFDLGLIMHNHYFPAARRMCDRTINISHGIISEEKPSGNHDQFMAVSENVRDHWKMGDVDIVRQPIDLDFWHPPHYDAREKVYIRYSYRRAPILAPEVAIRHGAQYLHVTNEQHSRVRDRFHKAKLVFASGRGALEAMACGAPVVVYDHRSAYQGALMEQNLQQAMAYSYSGRGGITPTIDQVLEQAERALPYGHVFRDWVEKHHDAEKVVEDLIA